MILGDTQAQASSLPKSHLLTIDVGTSWETDEYHAAIPICILHIISASSTWSNTCLCFQASQHLCLCYMRIHGPQWHRSTSVRYLSALLTHSMQRINGY